MMRIDVIKDVYATGYIVRVNKGDGVRHNYKPLTKQQAETLAARLVDAVKSFTIDNGLNDYET